MSVSANCIDYGHFPHAVHRSTTQSKLDNHTELLYYRSSVIHVIVPRSFIEDRPSCCEGFTGTLPDCIRMFVQTSIVTVKLLYVPSYVHSFYHVLFICLSMYMLTAVCEPDCNHGGTCIEPNVCACTEGWEGRGCNNGQ